MPRLTTYESVRADAWLAGLSEPDDMTDDRDAAILRAGWDLVDGDVPDYPRNPAMPRWHDERS